MLALAGKGSNSINNIRADLGDRDWKLFIDLLKRSGASNITPS
jgi:hypothetical protein